MAISQKSISFGIAPVRTDADLKDVINLFHQYVQWLDFDLAFQNFDDEMAAMPGKYAPPTGELLLARDGAGAAVGCVAIRPLSEGVCEMKRLYVLPTTQGTGVGKALVTQIINVAQQLGYAEIRLDTLPRMEAALRMYRSLGFVDIPAYYDTPFDDTHFLSLNLPQDRSLAKTTATLI